MAKRKTSKALNIYQIELDRRAVDAMPADARRMLFLFGHIGNDLNTQNRLLLISLQRSRNRIVGKYGEVRMASVLRDLIGTIFEGLRAVQSSFLGSPLGKNYLPHLMPNGTEALQRVRKHLGNMGLIANIRNSYSAHLPKPHQIDQAYSKIPSDVGLSIFAGDPRHSSLYEMSNLMITSGMIALVPDAPDYHVAMDRIVTDALDKAGDLNDFLEQIMLTIVQQHRLAISGPKKVATVRTAQSIKKFKIPPLLRS